MLLKSLWCRGGLLFSDFFPAGSDYGRRGRGKQQKGVEGKFKYCKAFFYRQ
jgi:hypothetical protein